MECLSTTSQLQPPGFNRLVLVLRSPAIQREEAWATVSDALRRSFILCVSRDFPFLTSRLHRNLAPPYKGALLFDERGSCNPLLLVASRCEAWTPTQEQLVSGNVASWPWYALDFTAAEDEAVPIGAEPTTLKVKVTWCRQSASSDASSSSLSSFVVVVAKLFRPVGDVRSLELLLTRWALYFKVGGEAPTDLPAVVCDFAGVASTASTHKKERDEEGMLLLAYARRLPYPKLMARADELQQLHRVLQTMSLTVFRFRRSNFARSVAVAASSDAESGSAASDDVFFTEVAANVVAALRRVERGGASAGTMLEVAMELSRDCSSTTFGQRQYYCGVRLCAAKEEEEEEEKELLAQLQATTRQWSASQDEPLQTLFDWEARRPDRFAGYCCPAAQDAFHVRDFRTSLPHAAYSDFGDKLLGGSRDGDCAAAVLFTPTVPEARTVIISRPPTALGSAEAAAGEEELHAMVAVEKRHLKQLMADGRFHGVYIGDVFH